MATAQQVLDVARAQVGIKESPKGSNKQKFGAAYDFNGVPWCAEFVWWITSQVGVSLPVKTASVYTLRDAFKHIGRYYGSPVPGDIVFFNYGSGHTGIVESVQPTTITTIEGNTSSSGGSNTNGGEVARKVRPRNNLIFGYGRPSYSGQLISQPTAPAPTEDDMPATKSITCPTGGYWVVRLDDGAVYAYGGAPFFGGMAGKPMNAPIAALGYHRNAQGGVDGYWLLGADGGVFAFGQAPFTDSYAAHPDWHKGDRYMVDIVQHGGGYDIIAIEPGTDPPKPDVYDLSVKR